MVNRLWNFLGIDTRTIAALDTMSSDVRDARAVVGLAEVLAVEGPDIQKLAPFIVNLDSLLDALNSPLAEIAAAVLSFIPLGSALLQLYAQNTRQQPTLAQRIVLVSQAAYLEAIKTLLTEPQLEKWLAQVGDRPASNAVRQKIQRLAAVDLRPSEAQRTLRSFQSSTLAAAYSEVLIARLSELGIEPRQAGKVALQLTQQTHKVLLLSLQNANSDRPRRAAPPPNSAATKRASSPSSEQPSSRSSTPLSSPQATRSAHPKAAPPYASQDKPSPSPPRSKPQSSSATHSTALNPDGQSWAHKTAGHPFPNTPEQTQRRASQSARSLGQEAILPDVIESFLSEDSAFRLSEVEVTESSMAELPLFEVSQSSRVAEMTATPTKEHQASSLEVVESPSNGAGQSSVAPSAQPTQPTQTDQSVESLGDSVEQLFPTVSESPSPAISASVLPEYEDLSLPEVVESALPDRDAPRLAEPLETTLADAIDPLLPEEVDESLLAETAEPSAAAISAPFLPEVSEVIESTLPETGELHPPDAIAAASPNTLEFSEVPASSKATEPQSLDTGEQSSSTTNPPVLPEIAAFAVPESVESSEPQSVELETPEAAVTLPEVPDLSSLTINELVALEAKGALRPLAADVPEPAMPEPAESLAAESPVAVDEPVLLSSNEPSPVEGRELSLQATDLSAAAAPSELATDSVESPTDQSPHDVSEPLLPETTEHLPPESIETASEVTAASPSATVESFLMQPDRLPLSEVIEPPPTGTSALPDGAFSELTENIASSDIVVDASSNAAVVVSDTATPIADAVPPVPTDTTESLTADADQPTDTGANITPEPDSVSTAAKDPEWFQLEVDTAVKKQLSIDTYLTEWVAPRPHESVFEEPFSLKDIYVPLQADLLTPTDNTGTVPVSVELAQWVRQSLNDAAQSQAVIVLQAEPGRGKSLFCSLFADWVRCHEHPGWTPILIHLRDVKALSETFEATLAAAVDREFATANADWLSDRTARFLFLLDGVDELQVSSEELAQFLQQAGQFQKQCGQNPQGHRLVLTTRPLALQAIAHSLPSNLTWLEILPLDNDQQQQWCDRWASLMGTQTPSLMDVLQSPDLPEWIQELAHEPLMLYRLAALHREGELQLEKFASTERATAEILICDRLLDWLITHRRPEQSGQAAPVLPEDLHHILQEVGLCIAQSAGGSTTLQAVRDRLTQDSSTVSLTTAPLAQQELDDFALWNVLTAFYLRPGEEHAQSLQFEYDRWGEFFYIKRLVSGLTALCQQANQANCISDADLCWLMYDLFSYPSLTPERVAYLMTLLVRSPDFAAERLHHRLYRFYWRWYQGEFVDAPAETLPQKALRLLQARASEQLHTGGQRQIDAQVGLNTLILLLELCRYGQLLAHARSLPPEEAERFLFFHPCSNVNSEQFDTQSLLKIIGTSQCLEPHTFRDRVGPFLNGIDLRGADLSHTDLSGANLRSTDLRSANLNRATLREATLTHANLRGTNLNDASLRGANLQNAHLRSAQLFSADLFEVNCQNANLSCVDLRRARLTNAIFSQADMSQANFTSADLRSSRFCDANLRSAIMQQVNLADADLSGANLSNADLSETTLRRSQLSEAILHQTNLSGVNLSDTDLRGADLSGANLSGANLNGALLVGTDLSGANLKGANFHKADLSGANLEGAQFNNTSFDGTNLKGANLRGTNLSGLDLDSANLSEVDLRGTNFSHAILRSATFSNALFYGTDFSSADLRNTDLSGTSLMGVTLFEANLFEANLSEADLSGVNLFQAKLVSANLTEANLSGANLSRANCFEADFSNADLSDADLFEANLGNANLQGTKLVGADLRSANLLEAVLVDSNLGHTNLFKAILSNANLQNAHLGGANFDSTDCTSADLTEAIFLSEAGAIQWDENTSWDDVEGLDTVVGLQEVLDRRLGTSSEEPAESDLLF